MDSGAGGAGLISPEEAKESRFRNIITRSVGFEPSVEPDCRGVGPGGRLLRALLGRPVELPDRRGAGAGADRPLYRDAPTVFIDLANERGGDDNITCLAIYAGNEKG